ncbi:MAG: 16S rRNA (guanine(527)-N(7))-methyltransferase RsmG [Flavobacteriales bacterium]|nr:16S rRNA (guanine(527)-N(7))-methyltransferase RsmG [Flavobacteriales bacterium]
MNSITKYFPELSEIQIDKFNQLEKLLTEWNHKINVISRKDIDQLSTRHILHSLAIAKIIQFNPKAEILDVGTGGGLPGIPLAILFPETHFHLVDTIGKKIKVVQSIAEELSLKNVTTEQIQAQNIKHRYDFIVSRAVCKMELLHLWVKDKTKKENNHDLKNGILCLKGGDLTEELENFPNAVEHNISDFFEDEFFETKKVVYQPIKYRIN